MRPDQRDAALLWDMLEYSRQVGRITKGLAYAHYLKDRTLQLAVERAVEVVGEAARHVSPAFKEAHPEISWRGIIAQRNVLAHEYGEIKQDRLWMAATERIPKLLELLAKLELPPKPPESDAESSG